MPLIDVACDHQGVRVVALGPRQLTLGIDQRTAGITSLVVGLVFIIFTSYLASLPLLFAGLLVAAFLIGEFGQIAGALIVRGAKAALHLLD